MQGMREVRERCSEGERWVNELCRDAVLEVVSSIPSRQSHIGQTAQMSYLFFLECSSFPLFTPNIRVIRVLKRRVEEFLTYRWEMTVVTLRYSLAQFFTKLLKDLHNLVHDVMPVKCFTVKQREKVISRGRDPWKRWNRGDLDKLSPFLTTLTRNRSAVQSVTEPMALKDYISIV